MSHSNRHLAQYGDLTWDDVRPDDSGFFCPDHGISPDFRTVVGSLLPHCPRCNRIVTQVEATDSEVF